MCGRKQARHGCSSRCPSLPPPPPPPPSSSRRASLKDKPAQVTRSYDGLHLKVMVVGVCDWHGDVRLALGDDHLVGLVTHDGHRLALEPGNQVFVHRHRVHHCPVDFGVFSRDRWRIDLGAIALHCMVQYKRKPWCEPTSKYSTSEKLL